VNVEVYINLSLRHSFLSLEKGSQVELYYLPQRRGDAEKKIIFCRKSRKNAQIKNHNNAFLCALRVFCGKRYFYSFLRASAV
jgi:hypothetical protein